MTFGKLQAMPVGERPDLVAGPVFAAIGTLNAEGIFVAEIDPALADTAAFCAHYDISLDRSANCVVLEATRGERKWLAACVVLASTRADVNGLARRTLDARRASFAPMEAAVVATGMEYGGITPVGLPPDMPILIDAAVAASDWVVIGSGIRGSKLFVPGKILGELPNAKIIESLGQSKEATPHNA